eukprot:768381-Hanusia_phi.AAC.1
MHQNDSQDVIPSSFLSGRNQQHLVSPHCSSLPLIRETGRLYALDSAGVPSARAAVVAIAVAACWCVEGEGDQDTSDVRPLSHKFGVLCSTCMSTWRGRGRGSHGQVGRNEAAASHVGAEDEPVCAIHVRRGDKGGGGRAGRLVVEMPVYVKEMEELKKRFSVTFCCLSFSYPHPARQVSTVYIAGDDAETVATMVAAAEARFDPAPSLLLLSSSCCPRLALPASTTDGRKLRAIFDSDEARTSTDNSAMMLLSHKVIPFSLPPSAQESLKVQLQVNITQYALDAITNTEFLASADYFIGVSDVSIPPAFALSLALSPCRCFSSLLSP